MTTQAEKDAVRIAELEGYVEQQRAVLRQGVEFGERVKDLCAQVPGLVERAKQGDELVSREGFNGECAYDHLAPSDLTQADYGTIPEPELRARLAAMPVWQALMTQAMKRLSTQR